MESSPMICFADFNSFLKFNGRIFNFSTNRLELGTPGSKNLLTVQMEMEIQ